MKFIFEALVLVSYFTLKAGSHEQRKRQRKRKRKPQRKKWNFFHFLALAVALALAFHTCEPGQPKRKRKGKMNNIRSMPLRFKFKPRWRSHATKN